jgi:hypothetical protein
MFDSTVFLLLKKMAESSFCLQSPLLNFFLHLCGQYHIQKNCVPPPLPQGLLYGNYLPIVILVIVTFTVIEAAGAAEEYPHLKERRSYG